MAVSWTRLQPGMHRSGLHQQKDQHQPLLVENSTMLASLGKMHTSQANEETSDQLCHVLPMAGAGGSD